MLDALTLEQLIWPTMQYALGIGPQDVDSTRYGSYRGRQFKGRFWTERAMTDGDQSDKNTQGKAGMAHDEPRATFHSMETCSREDWRIINQAMVPFVKELPDRVLKHLRMLEGDCGGFVVDRMEHSLQTATRA